MKMSWEAPKLRSRHPCANCGQNIPADRRAPFGSQKNQSTSDIVCTMACGNELAHRLVRAVGDDWRALIPPGDVAIRETLSSHGKRPR